MKWISRLLVTICALAFVSQSVPIIANAAGTAAEAEALVAKAIQYCKDNGKDKAIAAFNDPNGGFVHGDLYIFMFDYDGLTLAHGTNPKLVGKNLNDLKDSTGRPFIQDFVKTVKSGGGWVDYKWTNPETKKVQDKSSYVMGIPGTNTYVGCGIYK